MGYRARRITARILPPVVKRGLLTSIDFGHGAIAHVRSLPPRRAGRLPDFLIIGAQRCGTTYLYDVLTENPRILKASHKEIGFFDIHFHRGARWYSGNFPSSNKKKKNSSIEVSLCGEATPRYIAYNSVPQRVHDLLPHAKLIALVRNPCDRAISHHQHFCRLGYDRRSFADAIRWEYAYLTRGQQPLMLDSPERGTDPLYLSLGMYAGQLRRWLQAFPREQILVIPSDHLFERQHETIRTVTRFLGVPETSERTRRTPKQFPYEPMSPEIRKGLVTLFAPHNRELESLLQLAVDWDR